MARGKTGGGVGTNQHAIKGTSSAQARRVGSAMQSTLKAQASASATDWDQPPTGSVADSAERPRPCCNPNGEKEWARYAGANLSPRIDTERRDALAAEFLEHSEGLDTWITGEDPQIYQRSFCQGMNSTVEQLGLDVMTEQSDSDEPWDPDQVTDDQYEKFRGLRDNWTARRDSGKARQDPDRYQGLLDGAQRAREVLGVAEVTRPRRVSTLKDYTAFAEHDLSERLSDEQRDGLRDAFRERAGDLAWSDGSGSRYRWGGLAGMHDTVIALGLTKEHDGAGDGPWGPERVTGEQRQALEREANDARVASWGSSSGNTFNEGMVDGQQRVLRILGLD